MSGLRTRRPGAVRAHLGRLRMRLLGALDAEPRTIARRSAADPSRLAGKLAALSAGLADERVRERPSPLRHPGTPVTDRLWARLADGDEAAVLAAADDHERAIHDAAVAEDQRSVVLHIGAFHAVPGILERTGLSAAFPPPEIHNMASGMLAAGGALRIADLVVECLLATGEPLERGQGLDFGCSSGRVVRVLRAAYPEVAWSGCDPNGPAIAWARDALPGIAFFQSPVDPPLPVEDDTYDHAFAISIWSHHDRGPALAWLEEMRRVLKPGGRLVVTTHGLGSIAYLAQHDARPMAELAEIAQALYADGFWFAPSFGEEGDWGVSHPGWGSAFLSAEWLLDATRGRWTVDRFVPSGLAFNQDVYVLRSTATDC